MSVINGLYHQHLRSSIGFTVTGSVIYVTMPWHPQSTIDQIRVTNTAGTAFTITTLNILDTGAHYRFSTTDGKAHVIYRDPTDKNAIAADAYFTSYEFTPTIYHENLYDRPYLNLIIALSESRTNLPLRITATGKKAVSSSYQKADSLGLEVLNDYRVLVGKAQTGTGGTAGTIYDVTGLAKGTGGENASQFNLTATTDYVYVGSKKPIDHWEFQVGIGLTAPANLQGQYWGGTASTTAIGWNSFTVIDDTSTGNSDTMKFSGIVEGSGLGSSTWVPVKADFSSNTLLPNDPLTVQQNRIIAGGYPIVVLPPNPERYWVRFNLSAVAAGGLVTFNKILPVSETYETF
jgi:hypothetical protein